MYNREAFGSVRFGKTSGRTQSGRRMSQACHKKRCPLGCPVELGPGLGQSSSCSARRWFKASVAFDLLPKSRFDGAARTEVPKFRRDGGGYQFCPIHADPRADGWGLDASQDLEKAVKELIDLNRLSASKVKNITELAMANVEVRRWTVTASDSSPQAHQHPLDAQHDASLVSLLFRTHKKAPAANKLSSLYVVDAISREARSRVKKKLAKAAECEGFLTKMEMQLEKIVDEALDRGQDSHRVSRRPFIFSSSSASCCATSVFFSISALQFVVTPFVGRRTTPLGGGAAPPFYPYGRLDSTAAAAVRPTAIQAVDLRSRPVAPRRLSRHDAFGSSACRHAARRRRWPPALTSGLGSIDLGGRAVRAILLLHRTLYYRWHVPRIHQQCTLTSSVRSLA